MAKLYLKFEQAVLKEFALTQGVVTIGRLPDNLIQVDNLAVSGHHAKIYWDRDHYALEDNNSLNGTFVNNRRISKVVLKDGDEILIGKHTVLFKGHEEAAHPGADLAVPMVPTLEATVVLDTRKAKEMLAHQPTTPAGGAPAAAVAPAPAKERTGVFRILAGKTDQSEYVLAGKLTVVGKSDMASIRLKGWFAPKVAAVINHREGKYYIAASEKKYKVKINDALIAGQHELKDGDVVAIAGVSMSFSFNE
ncbi:MAG TPA: FHA domain-containing protein [Terriglobales bacterium]|nr:FHA domain-containing protein [Terriglobales bacterium]HET7872616.1 FHA domain-containing protein [Terriglobales bacterium]